MRKKNLRLAAGIAAVTVLLTACAGNASSSKFEPKQSSIFISRDGSVQSALVKTYENDYYSEEELNQFLTEAVGEYDGVSLVSCKMADGTANAVFSYGSAADFLVFAEAEKDWENMLSELSVMKVSEGLSAGLILDGKFVNPKGANIDSDKVTRQSDLYMVASDGGALIQTEGKVQYMSAGCTLVDDFTVQTPEEGRAYIIFK